MVVYYIYDSFANDTAISFERYLYHVNLYYSNEVQKKEPWDIDKIKDYFQAQLGTQFDAGVVKLLLSNIDKIQLLYK